MSRFVIGAGGHAKVVISTLSAAGVSIDGLLVDDPEVVGRQLMGLEVVGTVKAFERLGHEAIIAIGDNRVRQTIAFREGFNWISAVHPSAVVDKTVEVSDGVMIFAGVVVQSMAILGAHAILNTSCSVDHDCLIGAYSHLTPGVHLAGNVIVEEGAFMGCGSVAIPRKTIGAWSTVGAGGVVIDDVEPGTTVAGCPARPLKGPVEK